MNNQTLQANSQVEISELITKTFIGKTIKNVQVHTNSHNIWTSMTFTFTDGTEATLSATQN